MQYIWIYIDMGIFVLNTPNFFIIFGKSENRLARKLIKTYLVNICFELRSSSLVPGLVLPLSLVLDFLSVLI